MEHSRRHLPPSGINENPANATKTSSTCSLKDEEGPPPWVSLATSGSPGGLQEPPGPHHLTAPATPAAIRTNCVWPSIRLTSVCLILPGPDSNDCNDDLQRSHRFNQEPLDQPPGISDEKKKQIPGAADQTWAGSGPSSEVKIWTIRSDTADRTTPMCGPTLTKTERMDQDPEAPCNQSQFQN